MTNNLSAQERTIGLLLDERVMVISVVYREKPWSAPLYFLFQQGRFYFFSNPAAKHICGSGSGAVSIYRDPGPIREISGLQMTGTVAAVKDRLLYPVIIKNYIDKFGFLKEMLGPPINSDLAFFKEKFNTELFQFVPGEIFLTDNSLSFGDKKPVPLPS